MELRCPRESVLWSLSFKSNLWTWVGGNNTNIVGKISDMDLKVMITLLPEWISVTVKLRYAIHPAFVCHFKASHRVASHYHRILLISLVTTYTSNILCFIHQGIDASLQRGVFTEIIRLCSSYIEAWSPVSHGLLVQMQATPIRAWTEKGADWCVPQKSLCWTLIVPNEARRCHSAQQPQAQGWVERGDSRCA